MSYILQTHNSLCHMFLKSSTACCGIQMEHSIQTSSLCIGKRLPILVFYNKFEHCEYLCLHRHISANAKRWHSEGAIGVNLLDTLVGICITDKMWIGTFYAQKLIIRHGIQDSDFSYLK